MEGLLNVFPHLNASLNGLSSLFLMAGFVFIIRKRVAAHRLSMLSEYYVGGVPRLLPSAPCYQELLLRHRAHAFYWRRPSTANIFHNSHFAHDTGCTCHAICSAHSVAGTKGSI